MLPGSTNIKAIKDFISDRSINISNAKINNTMNNTINDEILDDIPMKGDILQPYNTTLSKIKSNNSVPYLQNLNQNLDNLNLAQHSIINLCIYRSIPHDNDIYIIRQYLLYKCISQNSKLNESIDIKDLLVFPFIKYTKNINLEIQISKAVNKINTNLQYKGNIEFDNKLYIFYEDHISSDNIEPVKITKDTRWIWGLLSEIINYKSILNYTIHESVYSIFLKTYELCNFNNLEIPIICFYGEDSKKIIYTTTFANNKLLTLTTHTGAVISSTKKTVLNSENINSENINSTTENIIRFAVFVGKLKIKQTPDDISPEYTCIYTPKNLNESGEPTWSCLNSSQYITLSYS